jgi:hypothetical protein
MELLPTIPPDPHEDGACGAEVAIHSNQGETQLASVREVRMGAQRSIPSILSTTDVVAFLREQHEAIGVLFAQVIASEGAEREGAFFALRRLLAVHETLEEEVVHPAARSARGVGEGVVERRVREEKEATIALAALEPVDVDAPAFDVGFRAPLEQRARACGGGGSRGVRSPVE